MKKTVKNSFRQSATLLGLTALSVLYLLEVDYTHIRLWNWIAFVIIALTLIPLTAGLVMRIIRHRRAAKAEQTQPEEDDQ